MDIQTILVVIGLVVNAIIAGGTITLWLEARRQRRALVQPLLVPSRKLNLPEAVGGLFCGNFSYPRDDEFKYTGLVYLGIRNIGAGVAEHVGVSRFQAGGKLHHEIGHQSIHVPPGETTPLIIRYGYNDYTTDLANTVNSILITYYSRFGDRFHLQLDLWFENLWDLENRKARMTGEAIVLRTSASDQPMAEIPFVLFRYMEYSGYYELQSMSEARKNSTEC